MAKGQIAQSGGRCYVYEILVDGIVRYVGKGSGPRAKVHIAEARRINELRAAGGTVRTSDFYNNLAKALREGGSVSHRIAISGLSEAEAFSAEAKLIAALGLASLWNETPGGDGFKIGEVKDPAEFHRKLLTGVNKRWANPKSRVVASVAATRRWQNEEQRDRHRQILRKSWSDPDLLARHKAGFRKRFASHEEMMEYQRWVSAQRSKKWAEKRAKASATLSNSVLAFGC